MKRGHQICPVDHGPFAVRTLQGAYHVAYLLEAVSAAPEYSLTVRALASASVELCQAVLCVRVANYEHDVVRAIAGHLERAGEALPPQGDASAALARQYIVRAVGMLRRMDEIDWTEEIDDAA